MKTRLPLAIATFLLLDFGALAFSFTISQQVKKDAVAINLSGRQRMLSQRITKAALLAADTHRDAKQRQDSRDEVTQTYRLFRRTLAAFADGTTTMGSDGREVELDSVKGQAALLIGEVQGTLDPWPQAPANAAELENFTSFMVERNNDILETMNRLTTALEKQSVDEVHRLRIAQTLAFLLSVLNFVGILIGMHRAKVQAEVQSKTDALTGLLNRGGFYAALRDELLQRDKTGQPLGIMLVDLNGFKAVNDTYGHSAGDATLREVARRLNGLDTKGWIYGRLGGDEFAIICPGLDASGLALAGKHVGSVLSGIPGGALTVSASVGWACVDSHQTADAAVAAADTMMYASKHEHHQTRSHRDFVRSTRIA